MSALTILMMRTVLVIGASLRPGSWPLRLAGLRVGREGKRRPVWEETSLAFYLRPSNQVGSVRVPKRGSWGPQNVVAARPLLLGDRAAMSLAQLASFLILSFLPELLLGGAPATVLASPREQMPLVGQLRLCSLFLFSRHSSFPPPHFPLPLPHSTAHPMLQAHFVPHPLSKLTGPVFSAQCHLFAEDLLMEFLLTSVSYLSKLWSKNLLHIQL